jgi:hypothetical protein
MISMNLDAPLCSGFSGIPDFSKSEGFTLKNQGLVVTG